MDKTYTRLVRGNVIEFIRASQTTDTFPNHAKAGTIGRVSDISPSRKLFRLVYGPGSLDYPEQGWFPTRDVVKIADTSAFKIPATAAPKFMAWYMNLFRGSRGRYNFNGIRNRGDGLEKLIALVLVLGGVKSMRNDASGWCGEPMSLSGFALHKASVRCSSYCPITDVLGETTCLLWHVLRLAGVRINGSASSDPGKEYSQASWLKTGQDRPAREIPDPLLLVAYFNDIKWYYDRKDLVLDHL